MRPGKGKQHKCKTPHSETNLGEVREVALSPFDSSVSAAAEEPQRRTEAVTRMQQEVQIKESSWRERTPKGGSSQKVSTEKKS